MSRPLLVASMIGALWLGPGAVASARRTSYSTKRKTAQKRKTGPRTRRIFASPGGRHVATIDRRGSLRVDGRRVRLPAGHIVGPPVWRPDGRALAFLHRAGYRTRVVVLVGLDHRHPLIWPLSSAGRGLKKLFWVSQRRIGVGLREMVPRLVFSWTTEVL